MEILFSHQQKRNVFRTTLKSVIDDAETFWRAFEENNYHIEGLDREIVKSKRTSTIIRQQAITDVEMEMMDVLIGKAEIKRRRTEKRRSEGIQTMEQNDLTISS